MTSATTQLTLSGAPASRAVALRSVRHGGDGHRELWVVSCNRRAVGGDGAKLAVEVTSELQLSQANRVRPVTQIEERRRRLRLNQHTAAEAVGVSRQHWSDVERGLIPTPDLQERVAEALGVTVEDLWPTEEVVP